jgi:hypothetical protein
MAPVYKIIAPAMLPRANWTIQAWSLIRRPIGAQHNGQMLKFLG